MSDSIKPFLKWPGGKRWLVNEHSHIFPTVYGRYFEPFLGAGAVFFYLKPQSGVVSDSNAALIDAYRAIREDYALVQRLLKIHEDAHSEEYYYQVRASSSNSIYENAARLIYLNRACWNGLYRVNLRGIFNVPFGYKNSVKRNNEKLVAISKSLLDVTIACNDFEETIGFAGRGDFVFADPPYTVTHNENAFKKYNERIFSWEDQLRLAKVLIRAKRRGAIVIATNANHIMIQKLYRDDFALEVISRRSLIAASAIKRGTYDELLIRST